MGTWTIQTTVAEDDAINYAHQQSMKGLGMPGVPPPPTTTVEEFFQQRTKFGTIDPMVMQHTTAKTNELIATLGTIPPENRAAAKEEIEAVIKGQGGIVKIKTGNWLWSDDVTPPAPDRSVIADGSQGTPASITKLFFDDNDNDGIDQRNGLLALGTNVVIRIEDPRQAGVYFIDFVTTGNPVAQTGYVELPVQHRESGGPLGAGWPMTCTFS